MSLSDRFWRLLADRIEARMHLRPEKDNAFDLGAATYAWRNLYVDTAISGDAVSADTYNATVAKVLKAAADGGLRLDHLELGNVTGAAEGELALAGRIIASTAIGARVYNNGNLTHASTDDWQTLTFDSETYDDDGIHSVASNTSRLTCQTAGLYRISGQITFVANATGHRYGAIRLDGTIYLDIDRRVALNGVVTVVKVSTSCKLAVGQYVELQGWQNSGGNLAMSFVSAYSPYFMMERIP